jgi:hypothetical protein
MILLNNTTPASAFPSSTEGEFLSAVTKSQKTYFKANCMILGSNAPVT